MKKQGIRPVMHMICNAHLDPLWQWEWEEGAAEAVSTFRTAADLCEEFKGFVFCHNEAILYRWILEYEPELFRHIQKLVRQKRWHIMGGWHVQPDCNMPSGESFIRQILIGKSFFKKHFDTYPKTAISFDAFGHTRGLVQILAKCGFDSYIITRPDRNKREIPGNEFFIWEGYDGSRVLVARPPAGYNSPLGKSAEKIEREVGEMKNRTCDICLWGVGNHGGGPSRKDLSDLDELIARRTDVEIRHSTPEQFFADLKKNADTLHVHKGDLNPWAVGCYTSMVRVKQAHRQMENELYMVEKMLASAWTAGRLRYPQAELEEVMLDLATAEFHDILPGSSIQKVEDTSLRMMDHGLEILSRLKMRAFLALAAGQPKAREGEIPVLVYNPHPFPVKRVVECEFMLADQNWSGTFTDVEVTQNGQVLPTQVEKERSDLNLDWRKRVAFVAELPPSQMSRFDCQLRTLPAPPAPAVTGKKGRFVFKTDRLEVVINGATGLMDRYAIDGVNHVAGRACRPLVIQDDEDPWGMNVKGFRTVIGEFKLLSPARSARLSGVKAGTLPPVRVVEEGRVRTVVEAVFGYRDSYICQRYKLPKVGTEIEIETRVFWGEKDRMLKLSIPTPDPSSVYMGQVAFGRDVLGTDGSEVVAQKWTAVISRGRNMALTCINDGTYGSDFHQGEMRLSLLRSAGYCAHPIGERVRVRQDRFTARMEQGERLFRFWLNGGPVEKQMAAIEREALIQNEAPMSLSFFPSGHHGPPIQPFISLNDHTVVVSATKKAEKGNALIIRLVEPTGRQRTTTLSIPCAQMKIVLTLEPYEVRTLKVNLKTRQWAAVPMCED